MKWLLIMLIRIYQLVLSPLFGNRCRFHPTCSQYAIESLKAYGMVRGIWLSIRRILRCHPFHPGGVDPVPKIEERTRKA